MHLGDQRAGGVEDLKAARCGLGAAPPWLTPCALNTSVGAGRHIGQVFDEDGALGLEVVHHVGVVHDLVAHVDRRAELAPARARRSRWRGPRRRRKKPRGSAQQDSLYARDLPVSID